MLNEFGHLGVFVLEALTLAACPRGALTNEGASHSLREPARRVMEKHCRRCHVPEENPNLPQALKIYNLREIDWAGRMTASQLKTLKERIEEGEFFDPYDARNEGKSAPPKPTPEEIQIVRDYADELLSKMKSVD